MPAGGRLEYLSLPTLTARPFRLEVGCACAMALRLGKLHLARDLADYAARVGEAVEELELAAHLGAAIVRAALALAEQDEAAMWGAGEEE